MLHRKNPPKWNWENHLSTKFPPLKVQTVHFSKKCKFRENSKAPSSFCFGWMDGIRFQRWRWWPSFSGSFPHHFPRSKSEGFQNSIWVVVDFRSIPQIRAEFSSIYLKMKGEKWLYCTKGKCNIGWMFPSHGAFGIHTLDASRKSGGLLLGINYQPSPVQRCNIADFFSPTVSLTKYSKLLKPLGRGKSYVFWTVAVFRKFWILTHKRHKSSDRVQFPIDRHRGWVKKCLEVNLTVWISPKTAWNLTWVSKMTRSGRSSRGFIHFLVRLNSATSLFTHNCLVESNLLFPSNELFWMP